MVATNHVDKPLYLAGSCWTLQEVGAVQINIGKARILRDGVVEVEKLTGPGKPETIIFPEPVGSVKPSSPARPLTRSSILV